MSVLAASQIPKETFMALVLNLVELARHLGDALAYMSIRACMYVYVL